MDNNYELSMKEILKICVALVSIADFEGCSYGFDEALSMAEEYIKKYDEDHQDE